MATLAFEVQADYEKVIRLREEITRLQAALNGMQGNGSQEAIEQLESQLSACREEFKQTVTAAAALGNEIQQSAQKMSFTTVEEQVNALSVAIHENERVLAEGVQQLQRWQQEGQEAFNAGNMGTVEAITADIQEQVARLQEVQQQTEQYKAALQGLTEGGIDTSLGAVTDSIQRLDMACDANRAEIERLTEEYNRLNAQYESSAAAGTKEEQAIAARMQTIRGEITMRRSLTKEMAEQATALQSHATAMEQTTADTNATTQAHESLRTKIKQLKMEMAEMRLQGIDEQSEAYKRLVNELGRLQDIQGDIARQGSIMANDERAIAGVQSGIQGLTGAFMGANAAVGLFGGANQQLQQVLVKSHYLMAISNGLQQAASMLNKDSAFRLVTLTKAREWWNKVLAAGRGEEVADTVAQAANTVATEANAVATGTQAAAKETATAAEVKNTAATAANTAGQVAGTAASIGLAGALRMVAAAIKSAVAAIPVWGWIVAGIGAVTAGVMALNKKTREARKEAEAFYNTLAEEVYKPIGSIMQLSDAWVRLGGDIKAQEKFIDDNKSKFDSLGLSIRNVQEAQRALVDQKKDVIDALVAEAKATVILNQANDGVKDMVKIDGAIAALEDKREKIEAKRARNSSAEFDVKYAAQLNDINNKIAKKEAERKAKQDEIGESIKKSNEYTKEGEQLRRQAGVLPAEDEAGSNNAIRKRISSLQAEADRVDRNSERYKALTAEIESMNAQLRGDTVGTVGTVGTAARDDTAQQTARYKDLVDKQGKEQARAATQMQYAIRQAEIDAMEEGNAKALAQIEQDYQEQQTAIEQWYEDLKDTKIQKAKELWEANPDTKGQPFDTTSVSIAYTDEETALYEAQIKANEDKRKQSIEEIYKTETAAMRDFLKEYGTYEEQRVAIAEEYAEKIAEAQTQGERMALTAQRDKDLQKLAFEYEDTTNWEAIFTNIDKYSVDYLQTIQAKLKDLLADETLTADQAESIGKQLNKVNRLIVEKNKSWGDVLGFTTQRQRELNLLLQDQIDAQDRLNEANERYNTSLAQTEALRSEIAALLQGAGIDMEMSDITGGNALGILGATKQAGADDTTQRTLQSLLTTLAASEATDNALKKDVQKNTDALTSATKAYEGASKRTPEEQADYGIEIGEKVAQGLQEMGDLTDILGFDESVGGTFRNLSDGVNASIDAFKSFASGDYVGAAVSAFSAIGSFASALGIGGSSDKSLAKDVERMTNANESLEKAINNLSDVISKNTTSLAEATEDYQKQIENLQTMTDYTQEMMSRSGAEYSNGFLGIGGHHSSNYKINKAMSDADWAKVSAAAGVAVSSAADFWNLTSEQMWNVATYASDMYAKIKQYADDGSSDAAQYMDEYIEYWKELDELTSLYNQKLTATDFDSVVNNFQAAIMDMNHSAADFADDFENMMKNAVISSLMSNTYADALEKWYDQFADAMADGTMTVTEQNDLRDSYNALVQQAQDEVNALYDTLGWSREGYAQNATTGGFTAMTEDTAEELNGRFTALQEAGYQILAQEQAQTGLLADLDTMRDYSLQITDISRESRTILADSYLELQAINENTADTVTQLILVAKYLKNVKENTDKL